MLKLKFFRLRKDSIREKTQKGKSLRMVVMSVMCPNLYRKQHTNKKVLVRNIERLRLVWVLMETSSKAQNNGFVRLKFVLKATHTQQKFEASTPRRGI